MECSPKHPRSQKLTKCYNQALTAIITTKIVFDRGSVPDPTMGAPGATLPLPQIFRPIDSLPASGLTPRTSRLDRFFWASPFYVFSFFIILFCLVPCGRLSWLLVSFWAHVNIVHHHHHHHHHHHTQNFNPMGGSVPIISAPSTPSASRSWHLRRFALPRDPCFQITPYKWFPGQKPESQFCQNGQTQRIANNAAQ